MFLINVGWVRLAGCLCVPGLVCGLRAAICDFQFVLSGMSGPSLRGRALLVDLVSLAILLAAVSRK